MEKLAAFCGRLAMLRALAVAAGVVAASQAMAALPTLFPQIVISRDEAKTEWPFVVEKGELSCLSLGEGAFVFFSEMLSNFQDPTGTKSRMVVVTTNPMALFASFEDRSLYAPYDSLETLIKRLAPYETMGRELCAKQKKT